MVLPDVQKVNILIGRIRCTAEGRRNLYNII